MIKSNKANAVLYGGSFDPPHMGHQAIVKALCLCDDIDKIILTPTFLNPFKSSSMATANQRLQWCKMLFNDPKVVVCDYEIRQNKPTTTYHTLQYLSNHYHISDIVIGEDNLISIKKWYRFDWLNEHFGWIVVERDGYDTSLKPLRRARKLSLDFPISSSEIRQKKQLNFVDKQIVDEVRKLLEGTTCSND